MWNFLFCQVSSRLWFGDPWGFLRAMSGTSHGGRRHTPINLKYWAALDKNIIEIERSPEPLIYSQVCSLYIVLYSINGIPNGSSVPSVFLSFFDGGQQQDIMSWEMRWKVGILSSSTGSWSGGARVSWSAKTPTHRLGSWWYTCFTR